MEVNLEKYPNLLDDIKFTYLDIQEQISDMGLFFENHYDEEVEDKLPLPPFINSFYEYVLTYQKLPKQYEWYLYYLKKPEVKKLINTEKKKNGLLSRMFRVYPSLVRDIHFSLYLREKSKNCHVVYNIELDGEIGIDVLIEYKGGMYGINLYTNTDRAKYYREKKYGRHDEVTNVKTIDIPVEFTEENKFEEFYLYGETQMETIKNFLINN
jgi:hypothetical protein